MIIVSLFVFVTFLLNDIATLVGLPLVSTLPFGMDPALQTFASTLNGLNSDLWFVTYPLSVLLLVLGTMVTLMLLKLLRIIPS